MAPRRSWSFTGYSTATDAEETRAFLGGKDYKFELSPRQTRQLNTRINAFYMPGMYLGYMHYGSLPIELSPSAARSDFLLQLPVRGHLAACIGGESVDGILPLCSARSGLIIEGRPCDM